MHNPTHSTPQNCLPTRRQFLVNCSAAAATVAMTPAAFAVTPREAEVSLSRLSVIDFARQLNTTFLVRFDTNVAVKLQLVEVRSPLPPTLRWPTSEDARNEKFALLFRGPLTLALAQDTYLFEHRQLGRFGMFIVPIGCNDQTQCYYEAIFNRPIGGGRQLQRH